MFCMHNTMVTLATQARSQKILLGSAFEDKVDLLILNHTLFRRIYYSRVNAYGRFTFQNTVQCDFQVWPQLY